MRRRAAYKQNPAPCGRYFHKPCRYISNMNEYLPAVTVRRNSTERSYIQIVLCSICKNSKSRFLQNVFVNFRDLKFYGRRLSGKIFKVRQISGYLRFVLASDFRDTSKFLWIRLRFCFHKKIFMIPAFLKFHKTADGFF